MTDSKDPDSNHAQPKSSFSFGFSKKIVSKVQQNGSLNKEIDESSTKKKDFILEVNEKEGIKGSLVKEEKKDLVIPCPGNTVQKQPRVRKEDILDKVDKSGGNKSSDLDDLTKRAAEEILKESSDRQRARDEGEDDKVAEDVEITISEDVARRAEVSKQEDYDDMPVQGFGMAMLRGMGFKAGEGIGGFKKADVKCLDPVLRPKGLGLGAQRPGDADKKKGGTSSGSGNKEEEELVMKKDACVYVTSGSNKEQYGIVEGLDEDSGRAYVKMAVGGKTVSISENSLKLVTKADYKKYSKVINKDMYDQYRKEQETREGEWQKSRRDRDDNINDDSSSSSSKKRNGSSSAENGHSKKAKYEDEVKRPSNRKPWIRTDLKVRFIDKEYKKGKYYRETAIIEDVVARDLCTLRLTADGRILEEIEGNQLETVIPKRDNTIVKVVAGKYTGEIGELLSRDKRSYLAAVQILPDRDRVLKLDFDDICEYVGKEMNDY